MCLIRPEMNQHFTESALYAGLPRACLPRAVLPRSLWLAMRRRFVAASHLRFLGGCDGCFTGSLVWSFEVILLITMMTRRLRLGSVACVSFVQE